MLSLIVALLLDVTQANAPMARILHPSRSRWRSWADASSYVRSIETAEVRCF